MTTEQKPLHSGIGAQTTAAGVLAGRDLSGKTAIVTGGYSGIGIETMRGLSEAGATVIVPARTMDKAKLNLNLHGLARVEPAALNLLEPSSIDNFAGSFSPATGRSIC